MQRAIPHTVGGNHFEIRIASDAEATYVQAFRMGVSASFRYSVFWDTKAEIDGDRREAAVRHLIELVKDDLEPRRRQGTFANNATNENG